MVSRKDVAERAGVSSAVVSYVLNNRAIVKEETRQKVLEAIQELGYRPNLIAQSLKTKKSRQIAVLVNNLGNSFEAGLLLSIEHQARIRGYFVFFQTYISEEEEQFRSLFMGRVDGIMLLGQTLKEQVVDHFQSLNIPLVSVMKPVVLNHSVPFLDLNWENEMLKLVRHLLQQGHKRIGFMSGGETQRHYEVRFQAFLHALHQTGCEWHSDDMWDGMGRFEQAEKVFYDHLMNRSVAITALICANDLMAAGCISACRKAKVKIPEQIAVTGCEDILMSSQTEPPLTTIHYPRRQMGEAAIQLLLDLVEGKTREELPFTGELIVRRSTVNG